MARKIDDVEAQVNADLSDWLTDSLALCEAEGLSNVDSTSVVMRALLYCLLSGLMRKGAKRDDILAVVSANWDVLSEARNKREH